jgi:two-component system, OmpR family, sensor histidine kinase MprB
VSLRLRIAAVGAAAVALAVLVAAVAIYLAVRSDLRGQIDDSLKQRAQEFVGSQPPGGAFPGGVPLLLRTRDRSANDKGPLPRFVQPGRFGGAAGYIQFVSASGQVEAPGGQGSTPQIPPTMAERQIAARGGGSELVDRRVRGTHLRVYTLGISEVPAGGDGAAAEEGAGTAGGAGVAGGEGRGGAGAAGTRTHGAVMIARPLTEVDNELHRILLILLIVGVSGIALAALLGAFVARTALAPIGRFTRRTESLAGELDLSERLDVGGGEELERLASSFNTTLDALERSLQAQRQLIADASHELRTPIASLRANIQTLEEAARLPPAEQRRLREDIIEELDELTSLVGDVVELARGARAPSEREDVRVDELVAEAVERTRRRGELRFELDLEPAVVRGEADRINRAVTNLLDNARKWSPPGTTVEVSLRAGVLTVRDHGPGFAEADLPHVFERFYRSESARKLPGSGLGLAIVRSAAEAHGGYARAGNAPGGGARMQVSFGRAWRPSERAEPAVTNTY